MKSRKLKKVMSSILASAMALSLAACGGSQGNNGEQGNNAGNGAEVKEFVYVPEFLEIPEENASYYNMKYVGDCLYYESYSYDEATGMSSESIVKYSLTDASSTIIPIKLGENVNLGEYTVMPDGSIYAVCSDYSGEPGPEGYTEPKRMLYKFGADGSEVFSKDLEEALPQDSENNYIQYIAADGENRLYLTVDRKILLLDAEGNYQGAVDTGENWINSLGCGKDGKVYFSYYDTTSENFSYVLAAVDFGKRAVGETYKGFLSGNGNGLYAGKEHDFLIGDGSSVYYYDLESQKSEKMFDWLDSDINGNSATCMGQLEDGRILAVINDWESNDNSIALLTKTNASEVAPRDTIVIGAMYSGSDLQAAAVKFNKGNDKYRISIRTYMDPTGYSDTAYNDALTRMNNDITSNNCPDIIDLRNINIQQLAAKGLFEDLNPYLESSSTLNRDDFVGNIIEAYTYNGVLVSIPASFELQTVVGSASELDGKQGWTIDEMIAYADSYPDAQLFNYADKTSILNLCMLFNESSFIDWGTGECKFDTPEFKSLLVFVNRFPDEFQYEDGGASTPTRIQNREILLDRAYIYDFDEIQLYREMFGGDVACIGYPTTDGSSGTGIMADQAYAITAKSGMKDGAWQFIESILTLEEEDDENSRNRSMWGFPNNRERLNAMAEAAVKVEYVTDENGEIVKDENGDPIPMGGSHGVGYEDGWSYDYRIPTQEEVDIIMDLIGNARAVAGSNSEILNIISEEAAPYFHGQKSVDEVTAIIQSRINIFVSENS